MKFETRVEIVTSPAGMFETSAGAKTSIIGLPPIKDVGVPTKVTPGTEVETSEAVPELDVGSGVAAGAVIDGGAEGVGLGAAAVACGRIAIKLAVTFPLASVEPVTVKDTPG